MYCEHFRCTNKAIYHLIVMSINDNIFTFNVCEYHKHKIMHDRNYKHVLLLK